ncbi:MAG: SCO family protein [Nitrospirota bacterium]|jgi:cytochrome oxidase Cu insertion factor (SCO1/SenC/PrrC family)
MNDDRLDWTSWTGWFGRGSFAFAAAAVVVGWAAFLLGLAALGPYVSLLTTDPNALRLFDEIRQFCLGYNPDTGRYRSDYLTMMVVQPVILLAVIGLVWGREAREGARAFLGSVRRRWMSWAALGLVILVTGTAVAVSLRSGPGLDGLPPRGPNAAPAFALLNADGKTVSLAEYGGEVVAMTFVYTSCVHTCPTITERMKQILAMFPGRKDLKAVAISMDPERDTPGVLADYTRKNGIDRARFEFLTGDPKTIEDLLSRYRFLYYRPPGGDSIDHANMLVLVDRKGRRAFDFSILKTPDDTIRKAVQTLLNERV